MDILSRQRGDSTGKTSEEEDGTMSTDEEEEDEKMMQDHIPSKWFTTHMDTYAQIGIYVDSVTLYNPPH